MRPPDIACQRSHLDRAGLTAPGASVITRKISWICGLLGICLLVSTGCASRDERVIVDGDPVSVYSDPFTVAGLPVSDGPNGVREGAEEPVLDIDNADSGEIDTLMAAALLDLESYWKQAFEPAFGEEFKTGLGFVSWDAEAPRSAAVNFCGDSTYGHVNAAFCPPRDQIGWDRGVLMPALLDEFGPMAPVTVIAHEYGHYIQMLAGIDDEASPIVSEQQADCLAGNFIRWIAEDNGTYLQINTSDGLNTAVAALISARDSERGQSDHGTAFERAHAFETGFGNGPQRCASIDAISVDDMRDAMPPRFDNSGSIDTTPFSEGGLKSVISSVEGFFALPPDVRPAVDTDARSTKCPAIDTVGVEPPVAFCPATNTVSMDSSELESIATNGTSGPSGLPSLISGDFSAYSLVASRYSIAAQQARGQAIDQPVTAARAACATGQWARSTADAGTFTLRGGDLDELVSGLLVSGAVASDVTGRALPSGFSRIAAFSAGYFNTETGCSRYDP
ncbi:UNVERIFIED_CONTAM: putative metalloprotease [Williamsia faeni]